MKGLFLLFSKSAGKLKDVRTITVTGMLMAMAVVLRWLSVPITPDVRVVFSFIPICIVGMFYGPVVCAMANVSIDVIGFIIDTKNFRGYSPQLSLLSVVIGIVYGMILYKRVLKPQWSDILRVFAARLAVVLVLNVCVRSYLLYTMYVNSSFSLFTADVNAWTAFGAYVSPRFIKAAVEFPVDMVLMAAVIPAAQQAYIRAIPRFGRKKV